MRVNVAQLFSGASSFTIPVPHITIHLPVLTRILHAGPGAPAALEVSTTGTADNDWRPLGPNTVCVFETKAKTFLLRINPRFFYRMESGNWDYNVHTPDGPLWLVGGGHVQSFRNWIGQLWFDVLPGYPPSHHRAAMASVARAKVFGQKDCFPLANWFSVDEIHAADWIAITIMLDDPTFSGTATSGFDYRFSMCGFEGTEDREYARLGCVCTAGALFPTRYRGLVVMNGPFDSLSTLFCFRETVTNHAVLTFEIRLGRGPVPKQFTTLTVLDETIVAGTAQQVDTFFRPQLAAGIDMRWVIKTTTHTAGSVSIGSVSEPYGNLLQTAGLGAPGVGTLADSWVLNGCAGVGRVHHNAAFAGIIETATLSLHER